MHHYFLILFSMSIVSLVNGSSLQHLTITDSAFGSRTITYEEVNGYAVTEGDILLGKITNLHRQGAIATPKIGGSRWSQGIVAYEIHSELPFLNQLAIHQAIAHWQLHTHLKFIELTDRNRMTYADYISFIPANGTTCASYVGRQNGKQEIILSPRCTTMNTVHEIGHAVGLWHEHSRADNDFYIRIVWENIEEEHQYNFKQHLTDGEDLGEYDYQSIMHYGPYAFSKNGQPTIIPLMAGVEIGQRLHLSEKDIAAINTMYPET